MKYGFGIPGLDPSIKGLGDVVAAVAEVTGVAAVARTVERVTGRPCGCAERRRALNEAFPTSYPQAKSESAPKVDSPSEPM
jgi:phage tail tape-measure protein